MNEKYICFAFTPVVVIMENPNKNLYLFCKTPALS